MDTPRSLTLDDAAFFIAECLSFSQLLFLLSYVFLESCLPAIMGDPRQIQDIIYCKERDWEPRIGREGFLEMKQKSRQDTDSETRRAWKNIREHLMQQSLVSVNVSGEELREQLCHLLCCIEQISSQGLNALYTQRTVLQPPNLEFTTSSARQKDSICNRHYKTFLGSISFWSSTSSALGYQT
jgi:hypothetical protein